jgi:hypothetical protein
MFVGISFFIVAELGDVLEENDLGILLAADLIDAVIQIDRDGVGLAGDQIVRFRHPGQQLVTDPVNAAFGEQFAHPGDDIVVVIDQNADAAAEIRFPCRAAQSVLDTDRLLFRNTLELFEQIAAVGGEGVSRGVRLVIKKDAATSKYTLESATINGEPVDPQRDYRITTIDYLLGGTDKMSAFKKGRNVNSPQDSSNNSRFIIMNYFREQQKQGNIVDAEIEGRITIK